MQSGQGFAFGKTLVTRHLARLRFTQSRLILNQPSQDTKAGLIYKKSHRVRGAAAPRKRSNPFFAAACTPQKTLCVEQALAQRNWPRQTRRLMSGQRAYFFALRAQKCAVRSEILFAKKGNALFSKISSRSAGCPKSSRACSSRSTRPRRLCRGCGYARTGGGSSHRAWRSRSARRTAPTAPAPRSKTTEKSAASACSLRASRAHAGRQTPPQPRGGCPGRSGSSPPFPSGGGSPRPTRAQ